MIKCARKNTISCLHTIRKNKDDLANKTYKYETQGWGWPIPYSSDRYCTLAGMLNSQIWEHCPLRSFRHFFHISVLNLVTLWSFLNTSQPIWSSNSILTWMLTISRLIFWLSDFPFTSHSMCGTYSKPIIPSPPSLFPQEIPIPKPRSTIHDSPDTRSALGL